MGQSDHAIFDERVWTPALEKLGAVTRLTVTVYDADARIVCGPAPATPLFALFRDFGYTPAILSECLRDCLAQALTEPAVVVVTEAYGVAVAGAPLRLEGRIVGAAVAGYAFTNLAQSAAIEGLARQTSIPFKPLWGLARQQQPVPSRRLILHGELLQLVGDTILRENDRTRQYEDTARQHQAVAAQLQTEMAAKDEFRAVLSHELRTPLTPILAWTCILNEQGENPVTRRKAFRAGYDRGSGGAPDNGEGIPRLFLPHVFDRFRQQEEGTRRRHAGLGIGRAIVKRLVELHQGHIDIASRGQDQGTEVTIRLPLSEQAAGAVTEEADRPHIAAFAALSSSVRCLAFTGGIIRRWSP